MTERKQIKMKRQDSRDNMADNLHYDVDLDVSMMDAESGTGSSKKRGKKKRKSTDKSSRNMPISYDEESVGEGMGDSLLAVSKPRGGFKVKENKELADEMSEGRSRRGPRQRATVAPQGMDALF